MDERKKRKTMDILSYLQDDVPELAGEDLEDEDEVYTPPVEPLPLKRVKKKGSY